MLILDSFWGVAELGSRFLQNTATKPLCSSSDSSERKTSFHQDATVRHCVVWASNIQVRGRRVPRDYLRSRKFVLD